MTTNWQVLWETPVQRRFTIACLAPLVLALGICGANMHFFGAYGGEVTLVDSPAAFALAGPERHAGPVKIDILAQTGTKPNWFIGQWNIAGGVLPPFDRATTPDGADRFISHNRAAAVTIHQRASVTDYEFVQDGSTQPCVTPAGRPHEFDLFANTVSSSLGAPPRLPSLADMTQLDQHISVRVIAEHSQGPGTRCNINQGNVLTAVTIANSDVQPPQVLFYQLSLHVFCGDGAMQVACNRNLARAFYWWSGTESHDHLGRVELRSFGYDQRLPELGRPFIPVGPRQTLDINLLPELLRLVTSSGNGIDPNPAHWRVSGAYHGQNVWGDVRLSTEWGGYRLTAQTR
jgi:hypothetical protein